MNAQAELRVLPTDRQDENFTRTRDRPACGRRLGDRSRRARRRIG